MLPTSQYAVHSVTGKIPVTTLGHMQCHEHIFLRKGPSYKTNPALCMDDERLSLQELKAYKNAGGNSIIDAQPGFFGRDPIMLKKLSEESGVNILAVTGFHKLMFEETSSPLNAMSEDALTVHFSSEILQGMCDPCGTPTNIKATLIKAALEQNGFEHPIYQKFFRAAARAAAETGAPIMVHTEKSTDLFGLLEFFSTYGIPANQVMICHLDRTHYDINYHRLILQTGCTLCYDSINRTKYISHEQELDLIKKMCDAGLENQIVLSLDTTAQRLRAYGAQDMGLDYILRSYIPMLKSHGITNTQIQKMCCTNAQIFFTHQSIHEKEIYT